MTVPTEPANSHWANPKPVDAFPLISDWIKFNSNKTITVFSGRVELGQGITQAFIQVAAKALCVDSRRIQLISGDTELCPNEGYTAGSMSIDQGGMSIRMAAASACDLFLQALAKQLVCEPQHISVRDGEFFLGDVKTAHSYWSMALTMDLAVAIPHQSLTHGSSINDYSDDNSNEQSALKNSLVSLLSGSTYIHDLSLPNMLHARVLLPPHPHAQLHVSTDELTEQLASGVRLVRVNQFIALVSSDEWAVTKTINQFDDLYQHQWCWPNDSSICGNQIDTLDILPTEEQTLVSEKNRLTGDNYHAPDQAISVSIARPCLLHASIGPSCAIAQYHDSNLTVWTHSQGVFQLKGAIAAVVGMDESKVRLIHTPGSGCYGHNGADDAAADAAVIACQLPNNPVRILYSRKNECQNSTLGPAMRTNASASLSSQGTINSFNIVVNSPPHSSRPKGYDTPNVRVAASLRKATSLKEQPQDIYQPFVFSDPPIPSGGAARNAIPGYAVTTVEVVHQKITHLPYRVSSIRSLGAFSNVMAVESLMDECALASNINPVSFRLNHLQDSRATAVINDVVKQSGWNGTDSGFGLAYARYKNTAAYCASVVKLIINEDIIVQHIWMSVDVGEVIDAGGVKAQLEGGAIQALSWTLIEQAQLSDNKVTINGWEDYPILSFAEAPIIDVGIQHQPFLPPLGCGEVAQGPVGAAILNAVRSVLDFRPTRLPLTRDSLVEQMQTESLS